MNDNKSFVISVITIRRQIKELNKLCGVENWEECTGHGFRALLINLVLGNNLSVADTADAVRHSSINSQMS